MGLDQYAFAFKTDEELCLVEQKIPLDCEPFFQWRKHPNLQGWMEKLYKAKGGKDKFNCRTVRVEGKDLDRLERDVKENRLPFTQGFFFGESYPEDAEDDLRFIAEARRKIADGYVVYYDSWW